MICLFDSIVKSMKTKEMCLFHSKSEIKFVINIYLIGFFFVSRIILILLPVEAAYLTWIYLQYLYNEPFKGLQTQTMVGMHPLLKRGEGWGRTFKKLSHFGQYIPKKFLEKGDNPEKGGEEGQYRNGVVATFLLLYSSLAFTVCVCVCVCVCVFVWGE